MKPYEVELLVAEVGRSGDDHAEMYHLFYDSVVIGRTALRRARRAGGEITEGARHAVRRRNGPRRHARARRAGAPAPRRMNRSRRAARSRVCSTTNRAHVPSHQERQAERTFWANWSAERLPTRQVPAQRLGNRSHDDHEEDHEKDQHEGHDATARTKSRTGRRGEVVKTSSTTSSTSITSNTIYTSTIWCSPGAYT